MPKNKRAIIKYTCVFTVLALFLFSAYSAAEEKTEGPVYDKFLSIGAETILLNNGLYVILKKDGRTPTVAVTLLIKAGSATENSYSGSGITHFIEHMMFKGSANYTAVQLENKLKSLGAEVNAFTTFDYTCFKVLSPSASLNEILNIVNDIIARPAFNKDEFQREREVILREIDMGDDDPQKHLSKLFWQTAYIQHSYRNPVIGYDGVFQQLQPADLISYHRKFYIPNNMVISIVGDIEPAAALQHIKQTLGASPRQTFTPPALAAEPAQISSRQFFKNFSVSQPILLIGFHTVAVNDPDLFALDTLAFILGGGETSRLYRTLHDEKRLVYSSSSYNYTPYHPGLFIISAIANAESANETIDAIKEEIKKIKQFSPKEDELNKAKTQVLSSYLLELQTQQDKADALAVNFAMTGDLDFSGKYVKGIKGVTADDVKNAALKYLTDENMTLAGLLPMGCKLSEKKEQVLEEKAGTVKNTLSNGLTVLVTENHTVPVCSIIVSFKGGLRAESEKNNGISNLTVSTMPKGTGRYKKEQLADLIESYGAKFTPYAGNNSFGFVASFISKDLEKLTDLLASVVLQPTFPEEEVALVKKDVLAQIERTWDDIFKYTNILLNKELFKGHPYRFISLGDKESVLNISKSDLADFHKRFCVGKNTVVSVSGDINSEKALEIITDKFKNMPEGENFKVEQLNRAAISKTTEVTEHMDKRQALLMMGFEGVSLYNNDRYPLQILSSLFSGGSGRLYTQIRQKEGLAYTLGTFGMVGLDTGAFIFYAATTPQHTDRVKGSIIFQIQQICHGAITEEEINAAKKSLITKYQLGLQSNDEYALQTGLDELYGLGYDYHTRYSDIINSVTRKDIITAAKKYLKLNRGVIVITAPK